MAQRNTYREDEELEEQINLRDLRRVSVYLKPYRKRITAIVAVVVSMSCIAVSVPYLTKIVIDDVLPHKNYALLGWIALIMLELIMLYDVVPDEDRDRRRAAAQELRAARLDRAHHARADHAVRSGTALPHVRDHARGPARAQGHAARPVHTHPDTAGQLFRFAPARQDPDPRRQLREHTVRHAQLGADQRDLRRVHVRDHAHHPRTSRHCRSAISIRARTARS